MSQTLQQKYEQLQRLCKKQQAQIIRLQNDIRERYQSYLLYTSRYKKQQINPIQPIPNLQNSSKSSSSIKRKEQLSRSRIISQQQKNQFFESNKKIKILAFGIKKQFQITVQPNIQVAKARNDQILAITQSFKTRITSLNSTKNQSLKKLQKTQNQFKELKQKNNHLIAQNEGIKKSQRKLKDKLKRFPEYEQKIDQIYVSLMKKVKAQQQNQDQVQQKHIHDKLQEIIKWILQNKQNVDNLLQNFKQLDQAQYPTQIIEDIKPQIVKPTKIESIQHLESNLQQKPNLIIQSVQSFSHSPQKQQPKVLQQNWTIISKLNSIDINPFQTSQVKSYDQSKQVQGQKYKTIITQQKQISGQEINQNQIFQEELRQSQIQIKQLHLQISKIRNKNKQIQQQKNLMKEKLSIQQQLQQKIKQLNQQLQKIKRRNTQLSQQLKNANWISSQYKQELNNEKQRNNIIKQQLQKSRIKNSQLQQSRITNNIQALKESNKRQKLNITQADVSNSKIAINQQLQAPYFVEEDLQHDANHEYVKRSFIRKKIVKRNLSATTYRIVSRSKEEVQQIVNNKIGQYRDKSKEKAAKLKNSQKITKQAKLQALQNSVNRVSEVSEPRDSDINRGQQIKIIEVTTLTPKQVVQTAKIYSKGGQSNLSTRRNY